MSGEQHVTLDWGTPKVHLASGRQALMRHALSEPDSYVEMALCGNETTEPPAQPERCGGSGEVAEGIEGVVYEAHQFGRAIDVCLGGTHVWGVPTAVDDDCFMLSPPEDGRGRDWSYRVLWPEAKRAGVMVNEDVDLIENCPDCKHCEAGVGAGKAGHQGGCGRTDDSSDPASADSSPDCKPGEPEPTLTQQIQERREDPEYMARLKKHMHEDREVLERLADGPPEKHFLVWRDQDGPFEIRIFTDQQEAVRAYEEAESELPVLINEATGTEVCLFGADSLATLCRTHAPWFAPETLEGFEATLSSLEKSNSTLASREPEQEGADPAIPDIGSRWVWGSVSP